MTSKRNDYPRKIDLKELSDPVDRYLKRTNQSFPEVVRKALRMYFETDGPKRTEHKTLLAMEIEKLCSVMASVGCDLNQIAHYYSTTDTESKKQLKEEHDDVREQFKQIAQRLTQIREKYLSPTKYGLSDKKIKNFLHGNIPTPDIQDRHSNPEYAKATSSGKTEALVKVVGYKRGYQVKEALLYLAKISVDNKTNVECEMSIVMDEKAILKVYDSWKKEFVKAKPGSNRKYRDAVHLIFSASCINGNLDYKKTIAAAKEVMMKNLRDKGFDYISALSKNSDHAQMHFVVRCKNRYPNQSKLRLNKRDLFRIRTEFAQKLTEYGLDHVATFRSDR